MAGRFVIALILLVLVAAGAHAHAVLLSAEPADGAALARAPASLRLRFNEPVSVATLRLIDRDGRNRLDAPVRAAAAGEDITVSAPPDLDDGHYVLSYRVVSADGHPVAGSILFAVGDTDDDGTRAAADDALERFWQITSAADRAVAYGAVLLAAGHALFALLIAPVARTRSRFRRGLLLSSGIAAVAVVLAVPIEGAALSAAAPTELLLPETWRFGWSTSIGSAANATLAGLALLAVSTGLPAPLAQLTLGGGTLLAVGGFGLTGHAATASPQWLMTPSVIIHGMVAALWIGSLPPLLGVLRIAPAPEAARIVRRFSRVAVIAVALLLAAGAVLAVVQLESPAGMVDGVYGLTLLAKLGGVAALLVLAAVNKWRLTPALANPDHAPSAARRLTRTIQAELALGALVVVATAWLGTTPPPRVLAILANYHDHAHAAHMVGPSAYTVATSNARYAAILSVSPAETGHNHLHVAFQGAEPREVTFELANPAAGIEPLIRSARRERDGSFAWMGPELAVTGDWLIRIEALVSDFERVVFEVEVPVR